eukprot:454353-Pyramimonas_sp.AAC.2
MPASKPLANCVSGVARRPASPRQNSGARSTPGRAPRLATLRWDKVARLASEGGGRAQPPPPRPTP